MSDEPFSLFDEVLDLTTRWQSICDEHERHAARLFIAGWGVSRRAADADLGALLDAVAHLQAARVMQAFLADVDELLEKAQERAQPNWQASTVGGFHTRPVPGRVVPSTSTREPGSEGRTRPESGQRKSVE